MPTSDFKPKFSLNKLLPHKSNSINNFATNTRQKSDRKECEQSEHFSPISPPLDVKSTSHRKFSKKGAELKKSLYE